MTLDELRDSGERIRLFFNQDLQLSLDYDRPTVEKIMAALAKDDYRFATLLIEVVKSDPFQKRTATGEAR